MADDEHEQTRAAFDAAVNMGAAELERWLATEESRSVGWAGGERKTQAGGPESVGHHEGGRIVEIKRKTRAELTEADYADMRKVAGYVRRHLAQGGPKEGVEDSRWRRSLMNWGHDPMKRS